MGTGATGRHHRGDTAPAAKFLVAKKIVRGYAQPTGALAKTKSNGNDNGNGDSYLTNATENIFP